MADIPDSADSTDTTDTTDTTDVDNSSSEKILSKISQQTYNQGVLAERISFIYENNKAKIDSFYNSNNQLIYYSKWLYNNDGLLSGIKGYLPSGELNYESTISYDGSSRIIQKNRLEENGAYETVSNYVYNSDNTISAITNSNGNESSKVYYINNSGIIYKEMNGSYITEVIYDSDNNPLQQTNSFNSISYTYNETIPKKTMILDFWKNIFGNAPNNALLFGNSLSDQANSYGNKFLIKEESESDINTIEYEFDEDEYPIKATHFSNNEITATYEYTYE